MKKLTALNCLGISLVLVVLACTLSAGIQPADAQAIVVPGGVTMWTSQGYYGYGQEVYLTISTSYPLHRARLEIRQWGGPDYRMNLGYLGPGQYTIDVGQSSPPAARINFVLSDGRQRVAYASCGTGP